MSDDRQPWSFMGVYGFLEEHYKRNTWDLIKRVTRDMSSSLVCFGDFNDILCEIEKKGLNRSILKLNWGRNVVEEMGLQELGFEGYQYTWTNGRAREANIQCRLDRVLASMELIEAHFPIKVRHLSRYGSDHAAIVVDIDIISGDLPQKPRCLFRFEEAWTKDEKCEQAVRQCWNLEGSDSVQKIKAMQRLSDTFKECRSGAIKK